MGRAMSSFAFQVSNVRAKDVFSCFDIVACNWTIRNGIVLDQLEVMSGTGASNDPLYLASMYSLGVVCAGVVGLFIGDGGNKGVPLSLLQIIDVHVE